MTPHFATPLRFQDNGGLPFILTDELIYVTEVPGVGRAARVNGVQARILRVPVGFPTDLASIPKVLWNVLSPLGRYDAPAVVHDTLYRNNGVTRKQADLVLLEGMRAMGVGWLARTIIYSGVRVGGWCPWNAYRAKEKRA